MEGSLSDSDSSSVLSFCWDSSDTATSSFSQGVSSSSPHTYNLRLSTLLARRLAETNQNEVLHGDPSEEKKSSSDEISYFAYQSKLGKSLVGESTLREYIQVSCLETNKIKDVEKNMKEVLEENDNDITNQNLVESKAEYVIDSNISVRDKCFSKTLKLNNSLGFIYNKEAYLLSHGSSVFHNTSSNLSTKFCRRLGSSTIPQYTCKVSYSSPVKALLFCSKFSENGDIYAVGSQAATISLFHSQDIIDQAYQNSEKKVFVPHGYDDCNHLADASNKFNPFDIPPTAEENENEVLEEEDIVGDEYHDYNPLYSYIRSTRNATSSNSNRNSLPSQNLKPYKVIPCHDFGWAIVDVAISPNNEWIAYSSWSNLVQMQSTRKDVSTTVSYPITNGRRAFCFFGIEYSFDSKSLLGGANDHCVYLYDLECKRITHKFIGHDDDVNCVTFVKNMPSLMLSGSDDNVIRLWDVRMGGNNGCVGSLTSHECGITSLDSHSNGFHLVSNSKDQTCRLWDMRIFDRDKSKNSHSRRYANWDYRYMEVPRKLQKKIQSINAKNDDSTLKEFQGSSLLVMTNHTVKNTLIRCSFSPSHTTGERYVVSGDFYGNIYVYDTLNEGQCVLANGQHDDVVREVAWHPSNEIMCSSSWDGTVRIHRQNETRKDNEEKRYLEFES